MGLREAAGSCQTPPSGVRSSRKRTEPENACEPAHVYPPETRRNRGGGSLDLGNGAQKMNPTPPCLEIRHAGVLNGHTISILGVFSRRNSNLLIRLPAGSES